MTLEKGAEKLASYDEALFLFGPRFVQIYGQAQSPMTITSLRRKLVGSCPRGCSFGVRRAFRAEPGLDQLAAAGRLMRGSSLIVAMVSRVI
ncbi:hypothetical protein J2046_005536 [Rhizobium petrolearium]|uniref:Uncharacterized protein n=2 Tax=Neorhizobium TaxID=1525371 RepID=A0ABV0MA20_9HYPH|nr:hypothetical protein [Neorhizobium petrolearium]MBP1847252.1 hypothetical protein [Neorhizobium petrolearium]MCC2614296.1 hypothetical protein [Neorhizobium petrolearium]WGI72563.1 hypothetical protein QEO92_31310 [Neorhizobium petrolearium]